MKTFKKVLGVVLAIAMLTGVFSMMASALAPDSAVDLYISTDKTNYAAGDIVTITVSQQVESVVGNMQIAGTYPIGYPSAALEPISDQKDLELNQGFVAIAPGFDNSISGCNFYEDVQAMGVVADAGAPWDSVIGIIVASDGTTDFDNTSKVDLYSFQMKVKADAPDGEYTIGFNKDGYVNYYGYSVDSAMGGVYGYDDDYGYGTTANYGLDNTCTFTVGAAGPKVDYYKAQIKMTPDSATTVKDEFQFRVQSVITDADWDAFFSQTATADETKNAITEMGIVAYKGAGTFDEATAKALVTDGTAATDYATAGTTYVQKTSDTADAYFGAIIKAKHSTMPNDVTYMGYVKYVDATGNAQVIFYETAKTAALASNYDNYVSAYLAANPFQG